MAELKPCPFCGGKAEVVPHKFYSAFEKDWKIESYGIVCKTCGTSGYPFFGCELHAVTAWNRRVTDGST